MEVIGVQVFLLTVHKQYIWQSRVLKKAHNWLDNSTIYEFVLHRINGKLTFFLQKRFWPISQFQHDSYIFHIIKCYLIFVARNLHSINFYPWGVFVRKKQNIVTELKNTIAYFGCFVEWILKHFIQSNIIEYVYLNLTSRSSNYRIKLTFLWCIDKEILARIGRSEFE